MAKAITKFMRLHWHVHWQTHYAAFDAPVDHGDMAPLDAQKWPSDHFAVASLVEEVVGRPGLPERTFKRRFKKATGYLPISKLQRLRVEEAMRRLERTDEPFGKLTWVVGNEDPLFFRRLFKRVTRISRPSDS